MGALSCGDKSPMLLPAGLGRARPSTKPLTTRSEVLAAPATQRGPAAVSQPSHRQRVLQTEPFSTEAAVAAVKKAEVFAEPSCPNSHH